LPDDVRGSVRGGTSSTKEG